MGTRGRGANRGLTVVPGLPSGDVLSFPRAKAPSELTTEQKAEWKLIVDRLPAQHFSQENLPLLAEYCRHIVSAKKVAQLIASVERAKEFDLEDYDRLLKMQERESRCLASLATRMRFSQHSLYAKDKKRPRDTEAPKPWEEAEDD